MRSIGSALNELVFRRAPIFQVISLQRNSCKYQFTSSTRSCQQRDLFLFMALQSLFLADLYPVLVAHSFPRSFKFLLTRQCQPQHYQTPKYPSGRFLLFQELRRIFLCSLSRSSMRRAGARQKIQQLLYFERDALMVICREVLQNSRPSLTPLILTRRFCRKCFLRRLVEGTLTRICCLKLQIYFPS